jgi:hypothetical protein
MAARIFEAGIHDVAGFTKCQPEPIAEPLFRALQPSADALSSEEAGGAP